MKIKPLINHFLIAMPNMEDPFFHDGVVFICEHTDNGAMGVLINKPSNIFFSQLFDQVKQVIPEPLSHDKVYFGGPIQPDRGFMLHTPPGSWQSSLLVDDIVAITTSKDILFDLAQGKGPEKIIATLGFSGWESGQLEDELAQNSWLTVKADPSIIFDVPSEERYVQALSLLGIDHKFLIGQAGHA